MLATRRGAASMQFDRSFRPPEYSSVGGQQYRLFFLDGLRHSKSSRVRSRERRRQSEYRRAGAKAVGWSDGKAIGEFANGTWKLPEVTCAPTAAHRRRQMAQALGPEPALLGADHLAAVGAVLELVPASAASPTPARKPCPRDSGLGRAARAQQRMRCC